MKMATIMEKVLKWNGSISGSFKKGNHLIRNSLILILGTGLSQFIPLLFSPVLTRVFSPFEFGQLAFFMACASIMTILSTGLFELAIMLPKKDRVSLNIIGLIVLSSLVFSVVVLLFLLFYLFIFGGIFYNKQDYKYLILLPLGIFFNAVFQAMNYWFNRKKQYKIINISKITQSTGTVFISIVLGFLGYKNWGLIIGYVGGTFLATLPFFFILYKRYSIISFAEIKQSAKLYSSYPKLMMPSSFVNTAASQAPIFFITHFFTKEIVGGFSFASRMLTAPVAVISTSIGQIYFKNISDIVILKGKRILPEFIKTTKILTLISLLIFVPIAFFGSTLFNFVFGAQWTTAGYYVQIISLGVLVKFIVSPLSSVFLATSNLKTVASWQFIYFCSTLLMFYIASHFSIITLLWIYVGHEIILYSVYYLLMIFAIKKFDNKLVIPCT